LALAVLCAVLNLIPVAVISGVLSLVALGIAGYDAIYNWLDRGRLRRGDRAASSPITPGASGRRQGRTITAGRLAALPPYPRPLSRSRARNSPSPYADRLNSR
jgi:hypothetical protein